MLLVTYYTRPVYNQENILPSGVPSSLDAAWDGLITDHLATNIGSEISYHRVPLNENKKANQQNTNKSLQQTSWTNCSFSKQTSKNMFSLKHYISPTPTPPKFNMSPEKEPFWKDISSFNHEFSRDMLVFQRRCKKYHLETFRLPLHANRKRCFPSFSGGITILNCAIHPKLKETFGLLKCV